MKSDGVLSQFPIRNQSVTGAHVYSHSGEYSSHAVDLYLPARGFPFQFIRKYRSANHRALGAMGRGWTFIYAKRLERASEDILYHDGLGRIHRFGSIQSSGSYASPHGLYMLLETAGDTICLKQRHGVVLSFERPETGGRLLTIADRNGNTLRLEYRDDGIGILDPLQRRIDLRLERNRVVSLGYADRTWQYIFSDDGCLIEVIEPPTREAPDGPRTRYAYDEAFRLVSITDPNNQVYLRNDYDDCNRISQQRHGSGIFEFQYETIGETDSGFPVYRTRVRLKNGALLDLRHDDCGHAVERTLFVSAGSLPPEDRGGSSGHTIPLAMRSTFNRHGEIVRRTFPAGDTICLTYDENSADPRSRGNLLEINRTPAPGVQSDQAELVTRYRYEPRYQQIESIADPRGNTVRFEYDHRGNLARKHYPAVTIPVRSNRAGEKPAARQAGLSESFQHNEAGQLIGFTDPRGARIKFFYHPAADPGGSGGTERSRVHTQGAGGYLGRILRDAAGEDRRLKSTPVWVSTDYEYDAFGNRTTILDGRGNATRFEYDARNRVTKRTRNPFGYEQHFQYDAKGNLLEAATAFNRHQYDPAERTILRRPATVYQRFAYNSLNNVVRRTIAGDGVEITHTLVRDAGENIVRRILPMGEVVEYVYDERNLAIVRRFDGATGREAEIRDAYGRNGKLRSSSDRNGNIVRYEYDGFNRYRGFENAVGTVRRRSLDEMGNVIRVQVLGDRVTMDERGEPAVNKAAVLLDSRFQYDEINRRVRMSRAWIDPLTGAPLGKSRWDGEEGAVSTVIEYGDNHLPSKVWQETGNAVTLQYDGANRPVLVNDETGESVSIEYDGNSNPVRIERLGPAVEGDKKRFRQLTRHEFDELDRLVARSVNGGPTETAVYNSLHQVIEYRNEAGALTRYLHDGLGRFAGRARTAALPSAAGENRAGQLILQRIEWNGNNRPVAQIDAADRRTAYRYDGLGRLSRVVYPDGTVRQFERDGNGNIVRSRDPNRTIVTSRFDARDRLIEQAIRSGTGEPPRTERFHYDGLNRLVAAVTDGATTVRRYDSLSRLLEESQSGRTIKYEYDAAGNRVRMTYPGGHEVRTSYDSLQRVTEVSDAPGSLIASYNYGSGTQMLDQHLGNVLKATFTYEPDRGWLSGVSYRSLDTGEPIEASKCRYDAAGNRIEGLQAVRGSNFGERYESDTAGRLVKVQYAGGGLSASSGRFEEEVLFELSPTGTWQVKTIRDAKGRPLARVEGAVNERGAYISLGNRHFRYDANGNRVLERNDADAGKAETRFGYDDANRLTRVETSDRHGALVQTIEYAYDAFNRQVSKRITKDGETRAYVRIWDGSRLIEEWQDGQPAKRFIYGARPDEPLQMSVSSGREAGNYLYLLNAGGSVAGLTDQQGKLVEAYRYDAFGQPFSIVQHGRDIDRPGRSSSSENLLFGGARLYDADAGISVTGSESYDPTTAQNMNDPDLPLGPVETSPVSKPPIPWTPDPRAVPGGMSVPIPDDREGQDGFNHNEYGIWLVFNGIAAAGVAYGIYRLTSPLAKYGFWGAMIRKAISAGATGYLTGSGDTAGSSGGGGGSGGSSSPESSGRPSGQPEDRPTPEDRHSGEGSEGKNAETRDEPQQSQKTDIEVDDQLEWHDNRPGHEGEHGGPADKLPDYDGSGGGTPNTVWDGSGGGNLMQLPDFDGGGGGTPNTVWDRTGGGNLMQLPDFDGGGGGTPNTVWDRTGAGNLAQLPDFDGGGGGTPNTVWDRTGAGNLTAVTASATMTLFTVRFI